MRMIFHVGLHRAASSALQRLLGAETARLRRRGTLVVRQQDRDFPVLQASFAVHGGRRDHDEPARLASRMEAALGETAADCQRLLFSDENFLGPMLGRVRSAHRDCRTAIATLAELACRHEVHVVLVLREHVAWLVSMYKFQVMRGDRRTSAEWLADIDLDGIGFAPLVDEFVTRLGGERVHVLSFEAVTAGAGAPLLALLARLAELPRLASLQLDRRNPSPPEPLFPVLAELARRHVHVPGGKSQELAFLAHRVMQEGEPAALSAMLAGMADKLSQAAVWLPMTLHRKTKDRIANELTARLPTELIPGLSQQAALRRLEASFAAWRAGSLPPLMAPEATRALTERFAADRAAIAARWLPEWADPSNADRVAGDGAAVGV